MLSIALMLTLVFSGKVYLSQKLYHYSAEVVKLKEEKERLEREVMELKARVEFLESPLRIESLAIAMGYYYPESERGFYATGKDSYKGNISGANLQFTYDNSYSKSFYANFAQAKELLARKGE